MPASQQLPVLIIDDDRKLCRLLYDYLSPFGYELAAAHTGPEGLAQATTPGKDYVAVILDVMLPGMDGFELLKRLRETSNVPVLMLTGLGEEADRIVGLEIGADDYLPKNFSTRELLARLRAVIRRFRAAPVADVRHAPITVGDLVVDPDTHSASLAGAALSLTAVEFKILLCLARRCGRVQSRENLLLEVADRDFEIFDRSIDVHISYLRRKLGDDARDPRFIQTIRSAGYVLLKPDGSTVG